MKLIREYIKKEFKRLSEEGMKSYPIPPEIRTALEQNLKLTPLTRYVSTLKASATVPVSYRVFFNNNQTIDLYITTEPPYSEEEMGIRAEVGAKSYWIQDVREANSAIEAINRLLTQPIPVSGDEDSEDSEDSEELFDEPPTDETEEEPEA